MDLGELVGSNVKRLRGELPQRALVKAAKSFGSAWSTGTVADLEAGRRRVTVEDVVVAVFALSDLLGRSITVRDLLAGDQEIQITKSFDLDPDGVAQVLAGTPTDEIPSTRREVAEFLERVSRSSAEGDSDLTALGMSKSFAYRIYREIGPPANTEEEQRIAKSLPEWTSRMLHLAAGATWHRTFIDERDRRAGPDASPQRKGHVTREMKAELLREVGRRSGDD